MPENNTSNFEKFVIDDTVYETELTGKFRNRKRYTPPDPKLVVSVIPGTVREIYASQGAQVNEGDRLLLLEAMKMMNVIKAPQSGRIRAIKVQVGDKIPKNHLMIEFE